MRKPLTAEDVIRALGGGKAVAALLDIDPRAVYQWKLAGIPGKFYLALSAELERRGIAVPPQVLGQIVPPKKRRAA